jgi:hypothetical protein
MDVVVFFFMALGSIFLEIVFLPSVILFLVVALRILNGSIRNFPLLQTRQKTRIILGSFLIISAALPWIFFAGRSIDTCY